MVEFDITIKSGDLYDFNMMHAYNSVPNLIINVLGAFAILFGYGQKNWFYCIMGAVVLLYLPWTLFLRSKQQVLNNPVFKNPLHYLLDENGITISQGETVTTQNWDDCLKAVSTAKSIIIYTSRVNATIFPKSQLGDKKEALISVISTNMPPKKVKIRT
ncbi:MAG: YcxB family protein [Acetatifactor sp.]|nr:YcxB family protein [Acetatifactor sp.]